MDRLAYPLPEAARVAGVSRTRIFEAVRKQELTIRKAGRASIVTHDDLMIWINSLPIGGRRLDASVSTNQKEELQFAQNGRRYSRLPRPQAEIRAELIGPDECSALGITVSATAPVLALCRQLIADGYDPGLPLEVWRGPVLCLRVRSIGEAAQLRVSTHGGGFERFPGLAGCTAASPVRENAAPPCPTPGRPKRTSEAAVPCLRRPTVSTP